MTLSPQKLLRRLALSVAVAGTFAGCSHLEVKPDVVKETNAIKTGPESRPHRSITGFGSALRCMDTMMINYGVRDVTMLVEDLNDQTKKVNAGTRDMLISAVSDMTRRSRALRLVAFGRDANNTISFLQIAQRREAYEQIPPYGIKGSVTQWDENVIRQQKDLGVGYQPFINLGFTKDAAASILALDLSVLSTDDLTILPGVTSRNSVVIFKEGRGIDGDAAYSKFGISFGMSLAKSEGQSQALRGLVELASIELVGKLTKTPYWSCLGVEPSASEEITLEINDWYQAMAAQPGELVSWFQAQMRRRGYYAGPIDGDFNAALDEAIANFRAEIGMSKEAVIDFALFQKYLALDLAKVKIPAKPAVAEPKPAAPAPGAAAPAPQPEPLKLALGTTDQRTRFAANELIKLVVRPSRDAHVYCYLEDENAKIMRFFPNRFTRDSRVAADAPLELPGKMRFQLAMNAKGVKETVLCFATPRDVIADLPPTAVGADFEALPVGSLDALRAAFQTAARGTLAQESLNVQAK